MASAADRSHSRPTALVPGPGRAAAAVTCSPLNAQGICLAANGSAWAGKARRGGEGAADLSFSKQARGLQTSALIQTSAWKKRHGEEVAVGGDNRGSAAHGGRGAAEEEENRRAPSEPGAAR